MNKYKFERLNRDAYPLLKKLYYLCFRIKIPTEKIENKYDTSAFGCSNVGFISTNENDEICANYCVFPIILNYGSRDILIAQSGDTMTSPKHQKKGLFIQLANKTYSLAKELGIQLIYGFPNEKSLPGFKDKLNWIFYGNMQRYQFNTDSFPLCEIASKNRMSSLLYKYFVKIKLSYYFTDIKSIDISIFNYNNNIGNIKKDNIFFTYKLKNENNHLVHINGFYMFIKTDVHLIIGDVGVFDKKDGYKFIKTLNQLAKILKCKKVIIDVSNNHWLYDTLKDHITPIDSLPIGFLILNENIEVDKIQFIGADYDTF